jgi:topoisomerase-4 subunit A
VLKEAFKAQDYNVRGLKAGGVRLASKEAKSVETK